MWGRAGVPSYFRRDGLNWAMFDKQIPWCPGLTLRPFNACMVYIYIYIWEKTWGSAPVTLEPFPVYICFFAIRYALAGPCFWHSYMCGSGIHFPGGKPWKQPHAVLLQVDVVRQDHQGPLLEVYEMEWEGQGEHWSVKRQYEEKMFCIYIYIYIIHIYIYIFFI